MKLFASAFLLFICILTACSNTESSQHYLDNDGAWTNKDIAQDRDMTQYEQGGHFWGRTRFGKTFGNEEDRLEGEKKVRDFIFQHFIEKQRGYIKFDFAGIDTSRTFHYFIEPNKNDEWIIVRKTIERNERGKFKQFEDTLNSVERVENNEIGDWFLISKSREGEILERLPVY